MANSADPDQLASSEANWSGATQFAKAKAIFRAQQDKGKVQTILPEGCRCIAQSKRHLMKLIEIHGFLIRKPSIEDAQEEPQSQNIAYWWHQTIITEHKI